MTAFLIRRRAACIACGVRVARALRLTSGPPSRSGRHLSRDLARSWRRRLKRLDVKVRSTSTLSSCFLLPQWPFILMDVPLTLSPPPVLCCVKYITEVRAELQHMRPAALSPACELLPSAQLHDACRQAGFPEQAVDCAGAPSRSCRYNMIDIGCCAPPRLSGAREIKGGREDVSPVSGGSSASTNLVPGGAFCTPIIPAPESNL